MRAGVCEPGRNETRDELFCVSKGPTRRWRAFLSGLNPPTVVQADAELVVEAVARSRAEALAHLGLMPHSPRADVQAGVPIPLAPGDEHCCHCEGPEDPQGKRAHPANIGRADLNEAVRNEP